MKFEIQFEVLSAFFCSVQYTNICLFYYYSKSFVMCNTAQSRTLILLLIHNIQHQDFRLIMYCI